MTSYLDTTSLYITFFQQTHVFNSLRILNVRMLFKFDQRMRYKFIFLRRERFLERCFILSNQHEEVFLDSLQLAGDVSCKSMVSEQLESNTGRRFSRIDEITVIGNSDPNVDDGMVEMPVDLAIEAMRRIPVKRRDYRVMDESHLEVLEFLEGIVRVYIPDESDMEADIATKPERMDTAFASEDRSSATYADGGKTDVYATASPRDISTFTIKLPASELGHQTQYGIYVKSETLFMSHQQSNAYTSNVFPQGQRKRRWEEQGSLVDWQEESFVSRPMKIAKRTRTRLVRTEQ